MLLKPELKEELELLLEAGEWAAIRTWFSYWTPEQHVGGQYPRSEEMIDKVLIWGHFFWENYLRDESPPFHRDLVRAFFSTGNKYIAAPRGFSKTTIIQLCVAFSIVNRMDKFIVIIEKTFTEASEVIKGVHDEFLENERIRAVYGNLIGIGDENIRKLIKDSARYAEARGDVFINGVRLRGKGFNSSIRGLKSKAWRPTRIILDDVEEDEHISNPEQRRKYENNYNKGVQPAIDTTGAIKVFGTILHMDSLLKNLIDNHGGQIYRAYDPADPRNTLLWPSRWSFERLEQKKKDMISSGQSTNAFAQEYLNDPISEEERVFKFDWLWQMLPKPDDPSSTYRVPAQYITMAELEKIRQRTVLNGYALIDVADTTTAGSDFTGCIVILVAPNGARFRVDVRREKRNVKGVIDLIFEVWEKWQPYGLLKIGVEKKGYADQILPLFNSERDRRGNIFPVIEELKPMGRSKENRIKGALQGFYENGKMISVGTRNQKGYFIPAGHTMELLEELYNFPSSKNDDLSDAEAYQADLVVVPLDDRNEKTPHRDPVEDPFEAAPVYAGGSFIGGFEDPTDIYE